MLYRLESVRKSFGSKDVLTDATWQHDPGRIVGLVGRNGAGKSTVLRIVQGLVEPDGGKRYVAGGTTFASLEQAVEPEGEEPLRAFVARAQESLLGLERTMRRLEEAIASHGAGGDAAELEELLHEHDEARERFERAGGYEADSRVDRVLDGVGLPRPLWNRPVGEQTLHPLGHGCRLLPLHRASHWPELSAGSPMSLGLMCHPCARTDPKVRPKRRCSGLATSPLSLISFGGLALREAKWQH